MGMKWNITGYAFQTIAGTEEEFALSSSVGATNSENMNWTRCINSENLDTIKVALEKVVNRAITKAKINFEQDQVISLIIASNFFENALFEQGELNTISKENYIISHFRELCHVNGTIMCDSTACSSGGSAIVTACQLLEEDKSDIVIVLGYDMESESPKNGMKRLGALTKDKIAPFSLQRSGTELADGIACLVIEKNVSNGNEDNRAYASIIGYGVNCDGYNPTSPEPTGKALISAINQAISMSGISTDEIEYVNAHGSGTQLNDALETEVMKEVFHEHAYNLYMNSSKSIVGHTLGAAGVVEAAITILEMNKSTIHPTANYTGQDEKCDLNYCFHREKNQEITYAISNSIGFGGINVCLLIERGIKIE